MTENLIFAIIVSSCICFVVLAICISVLIYNAQDNSARNLYNHELQERIQKN